MVKKTPKKKDQGQAIFEFVVILPFLLVFFGVIVAVIGSLNGAINQEKVVRSYFYARTKNNSTHPSINDLKNMGEVKTAGVNMLGWAEKMDGQGGGSVLPVAPCYKVTTFVGEEPKGEDCETKTKDEISTFIKPKTVYGLCSATYNITNPNRPVAYQTSLNSLSACSLSGQ